MPWIVALAAGIAVALVTYGRRGPRLITALRAFAATIAVALLLDAPLAPARPLAPWVALDASASWDDATSWRRARTLADSLARGADSLILFGHAERGGPADSVPSDSLSSVSRLVERLRATGRPARIVTDGRLDDAERLAELPLGSELYVVPAPEHRDLGIAAFEAPRAAVLGDTIAVRILLRAGPGGADARPLALRLGDRTLASPTVEPLDAYAERELVLRVVTPIAEGELPLVAALDPGDARAANDSVRSLLRVVGTASIALISTSPDQDARFVHAVLRTTQRGAVRAYWRVAPGQWREGDAARVVSETQVRRALEQASLAVLHGDTAYFGPPRQRTRGALVLMAPPSSRDEYYLTSAGDSPLRGDLSALPFDALPPLQVGSSARGAALPALLAMRGRRTDERAVLSLEDGRPRRAIVTAAGFWRWRTRGGRTAEAFDALWGTIFDWVTAAPTATTATDGQVRIAQELVPRPPVVQSGPVGTAPVRNLAPRARGAWWLAALALLALCGEWILRRRIGWR